MSIQSQIDRVKNAVSAAYTECNAKGATIPSAKVIENLATCIKSIISPSGTKPDIITTNGTHNVKQYENAVVNVPVPDGYVNIAEILTHCSRSASGEYSPTSNTTMNNIKITTTDAKGTFKPKIFVIFHNSRIENSGTDTAKIAVTASVTVARDDGSLLYKHSAGIYYNSTYRACSNQSGSRYFNPVSGGVQGVGSDFYLQSGKNYQWYAWG